MKSAVKKIKVILVIAMVVVMATLFAGGNKVGNSSYIESADGIFVENQEGDRRANSFSFDSVSEKVSSGIFSKAEDIVEAVQDGSLEEMKY